MTITKEKHIQKVQKLLKNRGYDVEVSGEWDNRSEDSWAHLSYKVFSMAGVGYRETNRWPQSLMSEYDKVDAYSTDNTDNTNNTENTTDKVEQTDNTKNEEKAEKAEDVKSTEKESVENTSAKENKGGFYSKQEKQFKRDRRDYGGPQVESQTVRDGNKKNKKN